MIISEKQIIMLINILKDTLVYDEIAGYFSVIQEQRRELYENILNQQSEELKDIKE